MKFKLATAVLISVLSAGFVFADDCGNHKDHGKGTPACKNNGNGGTGGNGGGGGNGGNGGSGGDGGSSTVTVSNQNVNVNQSNANSESSSKSSSKSNASSESSATGGSATQSQVALGGNANNAGNTQTTEFNQVRQTPSAIAPDAYPTAPCRVAASGAGSSPFFGLAVSGSKLDGECEKRETARSFALLGERQAALQILCDTNAAKKSKPTVCLTVKP